jgi:hypothetical protein
MTKNTEIPNEAMKVLADEVRTKIGELNSMLEKADALKLAVSIGQSHFGGAGLNGKLSAHITVEI